MKKQLVIVGIIVLLSSIGLRTGFYGAIKGDAKYSITFEGHRIE